MSAATASTVSPILAKLTELSALNAKATEMAAALQAERLAALRELPAQFGFTTNEEFLNAFREATGTKVGKGRKSPKSAAAADAPRHRASITPEKRKEFITTLKKHNDEKTALEWAQHFGVSVATVQNLREEAGVVEKR
jgi:AraC-like DNA-binding protein